MIEQLTYSELEIISADYPRRLAPKEVYSKLASRLPKIRGDILKWFEAALSDDIKKWFAAGFLAVVPHACHPLRLVLLRAAIMEENPSSNRTFILPLREVMSYPDFIKSMIEIADPKNPVEIAGVADASYWAKIDLKKSDDLATRVRFNSWRVHRFLETQNVYARRSLLSGMSFKDADIPQDVRVARDQVITIARNHSDEYIRYRLEIQLSESF